MTLRLATFNLENLDLPAPRGTGEPTLAARIAALRPALLRLDADILCLQEVSARHHRGPAPRALAALDALLDGTPYGAFARAVTTGPGGAGPADVHNLVTLSRWPITAVRQVRHELVAPPRHRFTTARPAATDHADVVWDRPLLHTTHALPAGRSIDVVNLHLRAPLSATVPGQSRAAGIWRETAPWAEGFFLATLKRAGQALEARLLVDHLLDHAPDALVAVCGDFNADLAEMPLRTLRADPDDTGNPALARRSLVALERRVAADRRFTLRRGPDRLLVDHVLASSRLAAALIDVEILNDDLPDEAQFAAVRVGSSHAPVLAAFDLDTPSAI